MKIFYSDHAIKRMKQRGITKLQVEYVLEHPMYVIKSFEDRKEAVGIIEGRNMKIVFTDIENYIKIITII